MAARSVDPDRVRSAAEALASVRDHGVGLDDELLAHLVVLGEREVQAAVDGALEQAADTVRALASEAAELVLRAEAAARRSRRAEDEPRRTAGTVTTGRPRHVPDGGVGPRRQSP